MNRDRRGFLALGAGVATLVACGGTGGDGESGEAGEATGETGEGSGDETGESGESTGEVGDETGEPACPPTAPDIEGPFYRDGIPVRSDLDLYGDDGLPLVLSGKVVDASCAPVGDAVIELWHASPVAPGGQPGDVDATYDATEERAYYGQTATAADGTYWFRTLIPGWYLNGSQYRPAHLHIKVWVGAAERLTTQLYFEGDPFNDADPWFNPETTIAPDPQGNATFDFAV
jgi:protocatechuate 3,4-dioxygenase beta subunit